jgi:hypothetical protein
MATLYYSVGEYNGKTVFCGRLEVTNGGIGWIALGVSSVGGAQAMGGLGSVAIIGNPMDGSVKVYDLYSIPTNGIVEKDSSSNPMAILESSTKATGTKTIMEFTKYEENHLNYANFVDPTNYILHARGISNKVGYHGKDRYSFKIDLPPTSTTTTATTTTTTTSTTIATSTTATTATTALTTTASTKAATTTTTTSTTVANNRPPIRRPTMKKPEKTKPSKNKRPRPTKKRPGNNIKPMNNNNDDNNKPTKKKKKKKKKKPMRKKPKKKKERQPRLIFN